MTTAIKEQAEFRYASDLGGLELLNANYHQQCFSRHVHEGFCIGVIEHGAQTFYRGGANHIAPRDSIIIVNADQVHDGHCATDYGWSYRAMYPTPEMLAPVGAELLGAGAGIPWFAEPVVHDPMLAQALRQLFNLLQHCDNSLQRQTAYLNVVTTLIQRHNHSRSGLPETSRAPDKVRLLREYIDSYCLENINLSDLSARVELNPHYLTRLFQRHVGLPPHAYQIMRRLQHAKQLMRSGLSLVDVAAGSGFTDQSHFSRHFKRVIGVTPGRYLKAVR
ncbi:AraC family transcriptional regulator [Marinobacterium jannaschii]|uniref:AraC family transcriptional regulator n=1 Tax=Marinobacterium jannaschii TaxID=64970 RepID=UPI0004849C22|nr:AraC family transcriptional regulator [Marinobacterium jannaschii]